MTQQLHVPRAALVDRQIAFGFLLGALVSVVEWFYYGLPVLAFVIVLPLLILVLQRRRIGALFGEPLLSLDGTRLTIQSVQEFGGPVRIGRVETAGVQRILIGGRPRMMRLRFEYPDQRTEEILLPVDRALDREVETFLRHCLADRAEVVICEPPTWLAQIRGDHFYY